MKEFGGIPPPLFRKAILIRAINYISVVELYGILEHDSS